MRKRYPDAFVIGCTTGGEILADDVLDETIVSTAIEFEKTRVQTASAHIEDAEDSFVSGQKIGRDLLGDGLATVFVLCDGIRVNGSELVRGIVDAVGADVPVTGGMAGDGDRFEMTLVGADGEPREGLPRGKNPADQKECETRHEDRVGRMAIGGEQRKTYAHDA